VNFNAPGQVVIAGEKARGRQAIQLCQSRAPAKRAMPLPVSGLFITALMRPRRRAAERQSLRSRLPRPARRDQQRDVKVESDPGCHQDALVRQRRPPRAGMDIQRMWGRARRTSSSADREKVLAALTGAFIRSAVVLRSRPGFARSAAGGDGSMTMLEAKWRW